MSPKGTQFAKVFGSQFALKPWLARLLSICCASCTHALPPPSATAAAIDGLIPPGRKKFIRGALIHGPSGPLPQGTAPVPTVSGLAADCPAAKAAWKLLTAKSPRIVFALIGRFRWRPPLKL